MSPAAYCRPNCAGKHNRRVTSTNTSTSCGNQRRSPLLANRTSARVLWSCGNSRIPVDGRCLRKAKRALSLPLISQPSGMLGSSGKSLSRASRGQETPSSFAVPLFHLRRSKVQTRAPAPEPNCTRFVFINLEPALGVGLKVERPALAHEPVMKMGAGNRTAAYAALD